MWLLLSVIYRKKLRCGRNKFIAFIQLVFPTWSVEFIVEERSRCASIDYKEIELIFFFIYLFHLLRLLIIAVLLLWKVDSKKKEAIAFSPIWLSTFLIVSLSGSFFIKFPRKYHLKVSKYWWVFFYYGCVFGSRMLPTFLFTFILTKLSLFFLSRDAHHLWQTFKIWCVFCLYMCIEIKTNNFLIRIYIVWCNQMWNNNTSCN